MEVGSSRPVLGSNSKIASKAKKGLSFSARLVPTHGLFPLPDIAFVIVGFSIFSSPVSASRAFKMGVCLPSSASRLSSGMDAEVLGRRGEVRPFVSYHHEEAVFGVTSHENTQKPGRKRKIPLEKIQDQWIVSPKLQISCPLSWSNKRALRFKIKHLYATLEHSTNEGRTSSTSCFKS